MKQMLKKLLIVFLAVLLAVITPMQAIAAGTSAEEDDEKVKYISELFLVNKENLSKYESNNAYLVYKTPIYKNTHSDKEKNPGTELYLVAELTTDAANAITDIKTMEMGGGYSFELFEQYLNEMRLESEEEAANLLEGPIAYFRDIYDDGEDPTDAALSAYQLLNCFIDDDPDFVEKNGEPARLGDLFASDDLTKEALTDILFMGNTDSVRVIKKALAIACSEDEEGNTFLDYMKNTHYVGKFIQNTPLENYETEAKQLLASLDEFYEAYYVYDFYANVFDNIGNTGYPATVDDFDNLLLDTDFGKNNNAEEFLKNYVEGNIGNTYELFYKGKEYVEMFSKITYSSNSYDGPDRRCMVTLLDFFTQSEDLNPDTSEKTLDQLRLEELEYFAAMLIQQGNGMMLELGLPELVSIAVSKKAEYQQRIADLQELKADATKEDIEVAQYAKDGISVFYGMDSAIYESGMVAMTTAAQNANANGDTSWAARQQEMNETAKKAKNIYLYSMIGSGALAATAAACFAKYASYTLKNYVPFFANAANEFEFSLETGTTGVTKALFSNSWQAMRWGQAGTVTMIKTSPAVYYRSVMVTGDTTSEQMLQTFKSMGAVRSAGQIAAGVTAGVMVVVSVAVLAFSVYMYVTSDSSEILTDAYTEIPAIICDDLARGKTNETTRERTTEHQYVYYYGVKNPDLKVTKSLYPITGDDLPDDVWSLPENKGNVQDIYNWELYGNRKWCCLYTTKDPFAGIPIIADSLKFDGDINVDNYVTVKSFDSTIGKSDLYKAFVECFNELEDLGSIDNASDYTKGKKLYIHYQYDASAAGARDAGETFTGLLGSIMTSLTGWGLLAGALTLGACGGAVFGNLTAKKKKKDDEGGKEEA